MKKKIEELQASGSEAIIDELKLRVRHVDYLEKEVRDDSLDYIAAKVKAEIAPLLRLARQVRRKTYFRWLDFQELLERFQLQGDLTRDNNYGPLPEWLDEHPDSFAAATLKDHIEFFNKLHREEDKRYGQLFEMAFEAWARPALRYAFEKVDVTRSEKEIVSYVCKTFYTKYIEMRAETQGQRRKRRNGQWVYYYTKDINDFDFRHNDVMRLIFHGRDGQKYESLTEMAKKLTKGQRSLLVELQNYVREDVSKLTTEQFYEKYPHEKMNYKQIAAELGYSYHAFVKNIERMRGKIV